jgi:hypothetical protein
VADEVGTAYVRLLPSMRGFGRAVEKQLAGAVGGSARKTGKQIGDDIGDEADKSLSARSARLGATLAKGIGKGLKAGIKPVAAAGAAAFAAPFLASLASSLVSGVAKLARGVGAALALAPAAAFAGVAAFGALKIAVLGVGDALKAGLAGDTAKFNEAIEGLSPSAKAFARAVAGMRTELDGLKNSVQERFFAPFANDVQGLATAWLPVLRSELSGMSGAFGNAVAAIVRWAQAPPIVAALSGALGHAGTAVDNVTAAVPHLVAAFLPLVTVGSTFLPQLTGGLQGLTARFAGFMTQAARTGQLASFIQSGIDSLRSLFNTGKQVAGIFADIGAIGSTIWAAMGIETGGLLDKVARLTSQFRSFLDSARGSEALGNVFSVLRTMTSGFMDTLERVAGIIGDVFGPLMPDILKLVMALSRLKTAVIDVGLDALEPVLRLLGTVLGTVVLPALTSLANWLASNKPVLQLIGAIVLTLLIPAFVAWGVQTAKSAIQVGKNIHTAASQVASGARTAAQGVGRLASGFRNAQAAESAFSGRLGTLGGKLRSGVNAVGRFASATVRGVGRAAQSFARLTVAAAQAGARVAASFIRMAAQAVAATARVVAQVAIQIARWVAMGIAALASAAQVALAWIISLGPIALIIAAVIAFVALVIANWDTIVAVTRAAFGFVMGIIRGVIDWVRTNWPLLLAILTGPIGIAVLMIIKHWDKIKGAFTAVKDWIGDRIGDIVGFFASIPGRVGGFLSSVWDSIRNGIGDAAGWVADKVDAIVDFIKGIPGRIGDIGGRIMDKITSGLGAISGPVGSLLGFASGGVVPGPKGAPQLVVAHGGETIFPTHSPAAMAGFTSNLGPASGTAVVPAAGVVGAITRGFSQVLERLDQALRWLKAINIGVWIPAKRAVFTTRAQLGHGYGGSQRRALEHWLSRVPDFAAGGIARHRHGGMLAGVAEREDEAIAPLSRLDAMIRTAVGAEMGGRPATPAAANRLEVDVTGGTDDLVKVIAKWIRTKQGGNVQVALSGAR